MRIFVRSKGLPPEEVFREAIERRVRFAVDRFEPRILEVAVQLADVNGPRGGVDKACVIVASLTHGGQVEVRGRSRRNAIAAVHNAAKRLSLRLADAFTPNRPRVSIRFNGPPAA
jgi:putative sigma-54 modulation protein